MKAVPVMTSGVVRINLNRSAMLTFSYRPVEVLAHRGEAQCAVRFGDRRIEIDCFGGCLLGGSRTFRERPDAKDPEPIVVISDSRVGERIIRIKFDCVVVTFKRPCES